MMTATNPNYPGKELESMSFAINYHKWIVYELAPYFGENVVEVGAGAGDLTAMLLQTELKHLYAFEPASNLFPLLSKKMEGQSRVSMVNEYFRPEHLLHVIDSVLYINVLSTLRMIVENFRWFTARYGPVAIYCCSFQLSVAF